MILSIEAIRVVVATIKILLVYSCLNLHIAIAANNTTPNQILKDPRTIVSQNGSFVLGFFSPPNSKNRYLGIWYNNVSVQDYVWVANRNHPIVDNSGVLQISRDGNLQVLSKGNNVLWSSNISSSQSNNSAGTRGIMFQDSGNLVLQESDGTAVWQSFDHPTDSVLPNSKLRMTSANMKTALQAWKSPSDPAIGRYSLGTDSLTHPQVVIYDGEKTFWRSGPWNGNLFLGLVYADPTNNYADTSIQIVGPDEVDLVYTGISTMIFSHYAFTYGGSLNEISWNNSGNGQWDTIYRTLDVKCDAYGTCGVFGTCNPRKSPMCRCLKGFSPKNSEEWNKGNWSSGCVRNNPLLCGNKTTQDGFFMLQTIKLPDFAIWSKGLSPYDCKNQCANNCSCLAYAYDNGAGCLYWNEELIDIQELTLSGITLYVHLSNLDLAVNKTKHKAIIAFAVIISTTLAALLIFFIRRQLIRRRETRKKMLETQRMNVDRTYTSPIELKDLPLCDFEDLVVATNNFHENNKLGHGGFGQVYKGKMKDGQEIAVKRLSTAHGQGLEEFTNEVLVISKLQHMNLVRLLSFCIHGEEKILVYEYMPNKSLDAFLFDPLKQKILTWTIRFNIIEGICRGLVYLHRDSRLRIIHRDLKASNILLDKDLNAKIADFGMARIFGRFQDKEETRRIVGTFGYMAPEYVLEGNYSEKSDVYSFGVLLLEIVTGKKNSTFWYEEQSLTLLGYVWNFWVEGNVDTVLDPVISHSNIRSETEKCIQVGLLCVQEFVKDRPNMSSVMTMLAGDIADLPYPKKPGFTKRLTANSDSDTYLWPESSTSTNDISFTRMTTR